jgi:hypothetical protein
MVQLTFGNHARMSLMQPLYEYRASRYTKSRLPSANFVAAVVDISRWISYLPRSATTLA